MNLAVIGSGGREHAICYKLKQSPKIKKLICIPGNAGTGTIAENIIEDVSNFNALYKIIKKQNIDLVIIGPEQPLVNGLADYLQSKQIKTFGPSQAAARLEGSKTFSKDFFIKYGIPTAAYAAFDNYDAAREYLDTINYPTVVKADGLAAGKGVIISSNKEEAIGALESIFKDQAFGEAGSSIVIEDFLYGEEASFIAVVSKDKMVPLATSQDHKAVGEGDIGLNTGGMGAYSPAPVVNNHIHQKIIDEVMKPTMKGLIAEESPYLGFLYAGIMISNGELKVLEFNCRFGDPETQPILLRLKSSLVELCLAAIDDQLEAYEINWTDKHACGVVIASKGYPESYSSNHQVTIKQLNDVDMKLFHAGTKLENNKILTSGGRVFCATALGNNLKDAQTKAYNLVNSVSFNGAFYRKDIGYKGIK